MAAGAKTIETRHWRTSYRGPVAIMATKTWNEECRAAAIQPQFLAALGLRQYGPLADLASLIRVHFKFGAIVGVGDLVECWSTTALAATSQLIDRSALADIAAKIAKESAFGNYDPGRYAWEFANLRRLRSPIPIKGHQGMWTLDPEIERRVLTEVL